MVCKVSDLKIFGAHNEQNVLAAILCCHFAGVTVENMEKVLKAFEGVEHRLEYVTTIKGVPYYNDSKATNTDSAVKALEAFKEGHVILIAGGHDKMTDLTEFMQVTARKTDALILLGEARQRFFKSGQKNGVKNIVMCDGSFEDAVRLAYDMAKPPQVVLLSPACSSYDMFANFPERGRVFKSIVHTLKRKQGRKHNEGPHCWRWYGRPYLPGLTIADAIRHKVPDAEITFVGTRKGLERDIVPRYGYPLEFIRVAGFERPSGCGKCLKSAAALVSGMSDAYNLVNRIEPDLVIGTGGYVCGPVLFGAP